MRARPDPRPSATTPFLLSLGIHVCKRLPLWVPIPAFLLCHITRTPRATYTTIPSVPHAPDSSGVSTDSSPRSTSPPSSSLSPRKKRGQRDAPFVSRAESTLGSSTERRYVVALDNARGLSDSSSRAIHSGSTTWSGTLEDPYIMLFSPVAVETHNPFATSASM